MQKISVGGEEYEVLADLGFQSDYGVYVKRISTPEGPRLAERHLGGTDWRHWTSNERIPIYRR